MKLKDFFKATVNIDPEARIHIHQVHDGDELSVKSYQIRVYEEGASTDIVLSVDEGFDEADLVQ